jgi:hypothetical protein
VLAGEKRPSRIVPAGRSARRPSLDTCPSNVSGRSCQVLAGENVASSGLAFDDYRPDVNCPAPQLRPLGMMPHETRFNGRSHFSAAGFSM